MFVRVRDGVYASNGAVFCGTQRTYCARTRPDGRVLIVIGAVIVGGGVITRADARSITRGRGRGVFVRVLGVEEGGREAERLAESGRREG